MNIRPPLVTGQIYHVMNHLVEDVTYCSDTRVASRLLALFHYYRSICATKSYSKLTKLNRKEKEEFTRSLLALKYHRVQVYAYCVMPTHIHLLLKQLKDYGISDYLSLCENSIAKYVNALYMRKGRLFRGPFKHVHIASETQFLHVSRYIHCNPPNILTFPFSSLQEYINESAICNTDEILHYFASKKHYLNFVTSYSEAQNEKKLST